MTGWCHDHYKNTFLVTGITLNSIAIRRIYATSEKYYRRKPKTIEQYQLTKKAGVIWLYTEDGKNWYDELKNFQDDTLKIAY
ncbi:Putative prophage tail fiber assembly like-protein [Escherichia coli]|nr:Putative prophage tail fiber assembly like-protein [Escherichia coli]